MNVKIVATKTCSHRPNLEVELRKLGISYELVFVEDRPDAVGQYEIRTSPNLIVDDEVVFRRQPTERELKDLLKKR